jgi:hypothetical protein
MTNTITIRQSLTSRLSELQGNITIIDNSNLLDFAHLEVGILAMYATWSGPAIINCTQTIRTLYEQNYTGEILVIDMDCMTPEIQIKLFGQVCHGWGEIFIIRNGMISKKYLGKDSFTNYKADSDKKMKAQRNTDKKKHYW